MGQAAIQAGVPVDVRLETPTHLSFQVPMSCHTLRHIYIVSHLHCVLSTLCHIYIV